MRLSGKICGKAKTSRPASAYNKQQYEQAAELFKNSDWKAAANYKADSTIRPLNRSKSTHTLIKRHNQGNALAQSGQLSLSLRLTKSLSINPDDAGC